MAADEVDHLQALIDVEGLDADLHALELQAQLALTRAMNCQNQFWQERARIRVLFLVTGTRHTSIDWLG